MSVTVTEGEPKPVHPESMDVKITNRCQHNCAFCHEKSTPDGAHANIKKLLEVIKPLPAGVEIALGGGNVFEHPELLHLLLQLKLQGLVANTTVRLEDAIEHEQELHHLQGLGYIHGLGVSIPAKINYDLLKKPLFANDNVVFHLIVGVNVPSDIDEVHYMCRTWKIPCKILILGFKFYGRGEQYMLQHEDMEEAMKSWKRAISRCLEPEEAGRMTLSFDNLALKQLEVQKCLTPEQWSEFYMGNDGQFTMYIDAVKQEYAMSSTFLSRTKFEQASLLEYFQSLQQTPKAES